MNSDFLVCDDNDVLHHSKFLVGKRVLYKRNDSRKIIRVVYYTRTATFAYWLENVAYAIDEDELTSFSTDLSP